MIQPLRCNVLVEPIVEEMTPGGIALPENSSSDALVRGRVIAVGSGQRLPGGDMEFPHARIGDVVLFMRESGCKVRGPRGEDYLLMNDRELLAAQARE